MFSSAFKSFSSNITSTYEISKQPTATSGVWTIFDAKKKTNNSQASIFVFERKLLEVQSNGFERKTSSTSIRKAQDEVVERLRKEASSLARLRHPSILQLVEPVEDTRSGGLMFATEPVIASLSGALAQKDRDERVANGRRDTRDYGSSPASRASQDVELDELEIQKGLLQIAKGLEFLHDSAKLVHGNLTPDAIFINTKSDWKISGLSFAGPADGAKGHQTIPQISLAEVLHQDPRIPPTVQLNLDYTSPDFVLDSNINFSADIFSLGLILLACYRSPHVSPIETHGHQSTYKKIFSSASTTPSPGNNYLCSGKLPRELELVLPKVLARRPVGRLNAAEFQRSDYFDNILVNTMRFLDGLPAKTPAEKSQFMKGLQRVMPQFPVSVLSKKFLAAMLDEMKDKDLFNLLLENTFLILQRIPNRQEALSEKVLPRLREIFLTKSKTEERDSSKEAGLNVFLNNIKLVAENTTAKQFKDDVLPIVQVAMETTTHAIVDAALSTLGIILPVLDFSTVKHDLFPIIANVFTKTSSLGIKVRSLEALGVLCGANDDKPSRTDDLAGVTPQEPSKRSVSSLDKFTMQEKVVPLIKGIKTKEPAVMMAALKVFQQIVKAGDVEFLATEVMPVLWSFALGPLLDLKQFKAYMDTIRSLSGKIEREQIKKLQELSSSVKGDAGKGVGGNSSSSYGGANGTTPTSAGNDDFERLVLGGRGGADEQKDLFAGAMSEGQKLTPNPPTFSWSSSSGAIPTSTRSIGMASLQPSQPASRSITPDVQMSAFPSLQPAHATTPSSLSNNNQVSPWATSSSVSSIKPGSTMPQPQRQQSNPWTSTTTLQPTQRPQLSNRPSNTSGIIPLPPPQSQSQSQSQPQTNIWAQPSTSAWSQPQHQSSIPSFPSSSLSSSSSPSLTTTPLPFTPMIAPPPSSSTIRPQQQQQQQQQNQPLRPPNYTSFNNTQPLSSFSPLPSQTLSQRQQQQQQYQQQQKTGLDKYESLL